MAPYLRVVVAQVQLYYTFETKDHVFMVLE